MDKSTSIVGVMYDELPESPMPLIYGRQFYPYETATAERLVMIGKGLAQELFPEVMFEDAVVSINGEEHTIIGVIGNPVRGTPWDESIYVPMRAIPSQLQEMEQEQYGVLMTKRGTSPTDISASIQQQLHQVNEHIYVSVRSEEQPTDQIQSNIWNNVLITPLRPM